MKIAMIGAGYVGLVTGACFADFGHDVTCIDSDPNRVATLNRGEIPIYEPGLEAMIKKGEAAGRLRFTGNLAGGIAAGAGEAWGRVAGGEKRAAGKPRMRRGWGPGEEGGE